MASNLCTYREDNSFILLASGNPFLLIIHELVSLKPQFKFHFRHSIPSLFFLSISLLRAVWGWILPQARKYLSRSCFPKLLLHRRLLIPSASLHIQLKGSLSVHGQIIFRSFPGVKITLESVVRCYCSIIFVLFLFGGFCIFGSPIRSARGLLPPPSMHDA